MLSVLFEMANCNCVIVNRISSVGRFLILLSKGLLILLVLYRLTFMTWLLKALALYMSVNGVLVPKGMLLFCCVNVFFCTIVFTMMINFATKIVDCVCDQFCKMLFLGVCFVFM